MVILLSDNILPLILSGGIDQDQVSALEYIAGARRSGKHFVFANKNLLSLLQSAPFLSSAAQGVYRTILNRISTSKPLLKYVSTVVLVGNYIYRETIQVLWHRVIKIPLVDMSDISTVSETIMICEDGTDCAAYIEFGRMYINSLNISRGVLVNFEPRSGGGNPLAEEYDVIVKRNNRFCLCIADSDISYPGGTPGETARKVLKVQENSNEICMCCILESRMIENLLPTSVLTKAINGDVNKISSLGQIKAIETSCVSLFRRYIHFKKGFFLKDVLVKKKNRERYLFLSSVYRYLTEKDIENVGECLSRCGSQCNSCSVCLLKSFGDKILDSSLPYLKQISMEDVIVESPIFMAEEISKIGRLCFDWGCAPPSQRT